MRRRQFSGQTVKKKTLIIIILGYESYRFFFYYFNMHKKSIYFSNLKYYLSSFIQFKGTIDQFSGPIHCNIFLKFITRKVSPKIFKNKIIFQALIIILLQKYISMYIVYIIFTDLTIVQYIFNWIILNIYLYCIF